ncbi:hypothetical protein BH09PSE1_BH09PSE1_23400 [soil metagenome]
MTIRATLNINGLSAGNVEIRVRGVSIERAADGWLLKYGVEYGQVVPWSDTVTMARRVLASEWLALEGNKPDAEKWTEEQLASRTAVRWFDLGARSVPVDISKLKDPLTLAYDMLKMDPAITGAIDA